MRCLLLSDLHLHNYKEFSDNSNGVNSRLLTIKNAFLEALEIGKNNKCKYLFIAGDLFQTRGNLKPSVLNMAVDLISTAAKDFNVRIISGNHDLENYDTSDNSAVYAFKSISNVEVYLEPTVDNYCAYIPYMHSIEDFKNTYRSIKSKVDDPNGLILMHQGIDNFKFGGIPDTTIDVNYLTEDYSGWVFNGHYHNPLAKDKVIQIGAPVQHHFGDMGFDRGCWVVDTAQNTTEFFKLTYPEFISCDATTLDTTQVKGKIVELHLNEDNLSDSEAHKGRIYQQGAIGCRVKIVKNYKPSRERTVKFGSVNEMLSEYIDIMPDYYKEKSKILTKFNEVSNEVS